MNLTKKVLKGGKAFPLGPASGALRRRSVPTPIAWALSLALLIGLTPSILSAQEAALPTETVPTEDEDIFAEGAFEAAVEAGSSAAEANKLEWFGGLSLVSSTQMQILPGIDTTDETVAASLGATTSLFGKAFLKASAGDLGSFFVAYSYRQLLLAGGTSPELRSWYDLQQPNLSQAQFSLSELHYSFDLDKKVFIRLGSQLLSWGASRIWSPADFVNQQAADAQALVDVRAGKPGLRIHLPFSGANIFAFADFSQTVSAATATSPAASNNIFETVNYALRVDATLGGFNIGLQGYAGYLAPLMLGATISGNIAGFDVWGEFGSRLNVNDYDWRWAMSLGTERAFGDNKEWALRAEYFYQSDGKTDVAISELALDEPPRPLYWGAHYLWLELATTKLFVSELGASLAGTLNISDLSFQIRGNLSLSLPKLIPFNLTLKYNGGVEDREFTSLGYGPYTVHTRPYLVAEITALLNI